MYPITTATVNGYEVLSAIGSQGSIIDTEVTGSGRISEVNVSGGASPHGLEYVDGRLSEYDANGGVQHYEYDANGLLDRVEDQFGNMVEVDYMTDGRVAELTVTKLVIPPKRRRSSTSLGRREWKGRTELSKQSRFERMERASRTRSSERTLLRIIGERGCVCGGRGRHVDVAEKAQGLRGALDSEIGTGLVSLTFDSDEAGEIAVLVTGSQFTSAVQRSRLRMISQSLGDRDGRLDAKRTREPSGRTLGTN